MPNHNGLGWFGNTWRGAVDGFLPGTQRGNDGRLIGARVATGLAGRAGSFLAGMAGGPAAAAGANRLAGNLIDNGNAFDFSRDLRGMPAIPRPELNVVPRGFEWTTGSGQGSNSGMSPNLGLPSGFANPNLGAVSSINAPNQYTQGLANNSGASWGQQSSDPFSPGYVAPGGQPARDNRSGNSAGRGVLAEGQDAQNMVQGMQIAQWLQGSQSAARSAMANMFRGKNR